MLAQKIPVLLSVILVSHFSNIAQAQPAVTWYYRGASAANGTTLTLNTRSSFVLGCKATGKQTIIQGNPVGFVITKGSAMSSYTRTAASGGTTLFLTPSGGTLIYDFVNGNYPGYDHIITSVSIYDFGGHFGTGYLSMYIPAVVLSDAGSYYCNFIDGFSQLSTSFANSGSFTLTVTTKSDSGSQSVTGSRSKTLEYSLVLLGAAKMLF